MRGMASFTAALLLLTGLALVPTASALPTCGNSATATVEDHHVRFGGIRTSVWEESNKLAGLQTQDCKKGSITYNADTHIATAVPGDLGILGICAFTPVLSQCF